MSSRRRRSQPYEIKGVDALFGDIKPVDAAEQLVSLDKICLPQKQPRRYFEPQAMERLVASVKQYGILQPILVRPLSSGEYELVAGERRYRAAHLAKLEAVPAVVREMDEQQATQFALLENLQREDLNPVEETEGILQLLSLKLELNRDAVIDLFHQAAHPNRESVDNVIHTGAWKNVLEIFETLGKFTPESFRTNRLPLLNLPNEILEALRQGQLAYTKARAIARVKDVQQRRRLLKKAITEGWSLSQIKEKIADIQRQANVQKKQTSPLKQEIDLVYRQIKHSKVWENPDKQERLREILTEFKTLLTEG